MGEQRQSLTGEKSHLRLWFLFVLLIVQLLIPRLVEPVGDVLVYLSPPHPQCFASDQDDCPFSGFLTYLL